MFRYQFAFLFHHPCTPRPPHEFTMAAAFTFATPSIAYRTAFAAQDEEVDSIMTLGQLRLIQADIANHPNVQAGWTQDEFREILFDTALKFANNGTSAATRYRGATHGIDYSDIALIIQRHCTRRQFGAYFAKVCFNYFVEQDKAPSKWQRFNFTEATKQVGFDFSFAINNGATFIPSGPGIVGFSGLRRELSGDELVAIEANRAVHIHRRNLQLREQAATTAVEITRGRVGSGTGIALPPPPQ
uniref:Coat protein n=1 Tax=Pistachio potex-like virus TaxID=2794232 RepID=A0A7T0M7Z0_9VIRU|nr:coat protein [Pistachio potex-like virus]